MNPGTKPWTHISAVICAVALLSCAPVQPHVGAAADKAQPQSASHANVILQGKTYIRLRTNELATSIPGKRAVPAAENFPHPSGRIFLSDGRYVKYDGNYEVNGTYRISEDAVWITVRDYPDQKILFFRSADGDVAMGALNDEGMLIAARRILTSAQSEAQ